jgi:hypothetical protein
VSPAAFALTPTQRWAIRPFLRTVWLAVTMLVAACGSISKGGDPQISSWNAVWPTAPDHAYWGAWKSPSADAWLQIESTGEGALFREAGEPAGWVRTPLRGVPSQWGGGWDFVTEAGNRYRLRGAGDDWIAVSGPGGEQRYARATLPEEVWAAAPYRPRSAVEGQAEFDTDESWVDSWWPF